MTQEHPLTPPPELVAQIRRDALHKSDGQLDYELRLIHDGYRAGADMELGECVEWLRFNWPGIPTETLRAVRRPKPKSQAEEALTALERTIILLMPVTGREKIKRLNVIRAALERLQELEGQADD